MAKQLINLGSSENRGDGDPLRTAFTKINNNFDEVYNDISNIVTFSGSYNDLTDTPTLFDGSYNSLTDTPDLSQYISRTEFDTGTITIDVNNTGDLVGSVFADDSTLIVDGVNANVTANILTSNIAANFGGTLSVIGETRLYDDIIISGGNITSEGNARIYGIQTLTLSNITGDPFSSDDLTLSAEGSIVLDGNVSLGKTTGSSDFYGEIEFNNGSTSFQAGQTLSVNTNNFYAREIHGPVDGSLYLGGRTSSAKVNNLALDATRTLVQSDMIISNNSTLSFTTGTSVNFTNATVTGIDYGAIVATQIQTNGLPLGTEASGLFASNGQSLALGYKNSEGSAFSHIAFSEANSIQIQANVSVAAATTFDFNGATVNGTDFVESNTTGITGADQVSNIVTLTQAEYDAIGTPNASTVYIIVG